MNHVQKLKVKVREYLSKFRRPEDLAQQHSPQLSERLMLYRNRNKSEIGASRRFFTFCTANCMSEVAEPNCCAWR